MAVTAPPLLQAYFFNYALFAAVPAEEHYLYKFDLLPPMSLLNLTLIGWNIKRCIKAPFEPAENRVKRRRQYQVGLPSAAVMEAQLNDRVIYK